MSDWVISIGTCMAGVHYTTLMGMGEGGGGGGRGGDNVGSPPPR